MGTQDIKIFLPVKILDKQWADKLLAGSVFMRSLYEFGIWNADAKAKGLAREMDNSFRGDILEGLAINVDPKKGDSFFNGIFTPETKAYIPRMWYYDEKLFKYLKVYCMYCLTYNKNKKHFEQPDERLRDFGNTAVIVYHPDEFVRRIHLALYKRFEDGINFKIREVFYYDITKDFGSFDVFWKEKQFEWQKEIRMTVALLDTNTVKIDEKGRQLKALIQDTNPLTLDIGSIEDITITIPTEDLVNLKLPAEFKIPD